MWIIRGRLRLVEDICRRQSGLARPHHLLHLVLVLISFSPCFTFFLALSYSFPTSRPFFLLFFSGFSYSVPTSLPSPCFIYLSIYFSFFILCPYFSSFLPVLFFCSNSSNSITLICIFFYPLPSLLSYSFSSFYFFSSSSSKVSLILHTTRYTQYTHPHTYDNADAHTHTHIQIHKQTDAV